MNDAIRPGDASTTPVEPGMFCWHEILANDIEKAASHYAELFGWTAEPFELPGETIRVFLRNGDIVAGCGDLANDPLERGPRWRSFVAVDDPRGTCDRAVSLGGRVLLPATDLPMGTYAAIEAPGGAEVGVFRGGDGRNAVGDGAVMHNELLARDLETAVGFHRDLLAWHPVEHDMGTAYVVFHGGGAGGPMRGGAMTPPPGTPLERDMWLPYVQVADCDATAARAESLGGRIAAPPMDVPTVGRIAVLLDPEFASLAIWSPIA